MRSISRGALVAGLAIFAVGAHAEAQTVPTPEEHFGHVIGATETLARWDDMLEYYEILAKASDRMVLDTLGLTTLGNPFILITMSSPENLARNGEIQETSKVLAEGRVSRTEAERLAANIPATVFINHNIHSTEVASAQTSVQLVYDLATRQDAEAQQILDNVVMYLIPSANPDGQIMVTDWYRQIKGSETPNARMPYLYHHYAGHDNNRDFFQGALIETRHWFKVMFEMSAAQVYLDQHQMGGSGPRMFVPPYPDPMNPLVHPLLWQQIQFMGGGIVTDLQAAGKQGVLSGSMYRIFGQEGALTQRFHNVVGLLTESASANLASPDTVTMDELERSAGRRGPGAKYEFSMDMPDPWMGGEWTVGDIVEYQMIAAVSVLRQTAKFREDYILGRWQMAKETMERARANGPFAFVIPAGQVDDLTATDLMRRLSWQGIEIYQATEDFEAFPTLLDTIADVAGIRQALGAGNGEEAEGDGEEGEAESEDPEEEAQEVPEPVVRSFEAGSYIVYVAQPARAALMDLLEPRFLPIRHEYPDGPFLRMYDGAAYTMSMQMGVETVRVDDPFEVDAEEVGTVEHPMVPRASTARRWFAMSSEVNESYRSANALLEAGFTVHRAAEELVLGDRSMRGAFLIPADQPGLEQALLEHAGGVPVFADPANVGVTEPMSRARVGLYKGWAGSMDEGWTRLFMDEYGFDYESLGNEDMRDEGLGSRYDVIVLPSEISLNRLIEGTSEENTPQEYAGGIGDEGVENLKRFVENGGTLVTLDRGDQVVMEHFDVPVADALADVDRSEFFLPSSLLNVDLKQDHDLTAGSPERVIAKWAGGRAYEPTGWDGASSDIKVVGRWADEPSEVLAAGQLVGPEHLAGKGAILEVEYGAGRILMYGFRVQHRVQTHGTFKLLFNALMKSGSRPAM